MSEYEKAFDRWSTAVDKFDYYISGIVGAGLIYLVKETKIEKLGLNTSTFELLATVLLLLTFVVSVRRLERMHTLKRFEAQNLDIKRYRDKIMTSPEDQVFLSSTDYTPLTPDDVGKMKENLDRGNSGIAEGMEKIGKSTSDLYAWRTRFLYASLIVLLMAQVVDPGMKIWQNQSCHTTPASAPR